ncbi:MAG: TolC family protein [Candidatus Caenarcaniphilales bacterium]|nr:TolC family protein [Candidatus Caenarcaniphilales bacterium]
MSSAQVIRIIASALVLTSLTQLVSADEIKPQELIEKAPTLKGNVKDETYENYLSKNNLVILDLRTTLQAAQDDSLRIEAQEYQLNQYHDALIGAIGQFLPSITLSTSLLKRDGNIQLFSDQVLPVRQDSIQSRISGSFNFFQGGRVFFGFINSSLNHEKAKKDLDATKQKVLAETANHYFTLQRNAAELESELARLTQAEQNLRERKIALEAGDDIKVSVLLAEQEVEESKARIATLKQQFYTESASLNRELNIAPNILILPINQAPDKALLNWHDGINQDQLVAFAVLHRPDLLSLKLQVEAQRMAQYQKLSPFLPVLSLTASTGFVGPEMNQQFPDSQLTLSAQYNGLTNLGVSALADFLQAKHLKMQLKTQYLDQLKQLEAEITGLFAGVISGEQNLKASKAAYDAAQESYRQSLVRLNEGVGTSYELTTTQTGLERARTNYFNAVLNYQVAQVNLLKAIGMITIDNVVDGVKL